MAKYLQAILVICCLVEVIFPRPLQTENSFRIELRRLNTSLNKINDTIKNGCRVPKIDLVPKVKQNKTVLCITQYPDNFHNINCVLNYIQNNTTCNNTLVAEMQKSAAILARGHHVTGCPTTPRYSMKEFFPHLYSYVNRLTEVCINGTWVYRGL